MAAPARARDPQSVLFACGQNSVRSPMAAGLLHAMFPNALYVRSAANQRVQELAREYGDLIMPHLWTGITKVRPGAGIAVVGDPQQCAATLQQFIDAGCHSFCLSGYLHDEEAERFGRLIRPLLAQRNPGRLAA